MSHQVVLNFEDGVSRAIDCDPDMTIADAAYRARINIPFDCRDGACGTCKAKCDAGEFDPGFFIDDALSRDEAAAGFCLPCQMKPLSDLVLQISSTSELAKTGTQSWRGEVAEVIRHSPTTVGLKITMADRERLTFLPGQYVNITVPGTDQVRSYSFSNAADSAELSFLIKITPGGAMSTWVSERARPGDRLEFSGPLGSFYLRPVKRRALLLAGGTGLAPILAMLHTLAAKPPEHPVHLVYGATTDDDVVHLADLADFAERIENLTFDWCVADERTTAPNQGYVMSLIDAEHLAGGDVDVYLCGPPPMVEAVRGWLDEQGIAPASFHFEKFTVGRAHGAAPAESTPADPPAAEPPPHAPAAEPAPHAPAARPRVAARIATVPDPDQAHRLAGQRMLAPDDRMPIGSGAPTGGGMAAGRAEARELHRFRFAACDLGPAPGAARPLDRRAEAAAARAIAGQAVFAAADRAPLVAPRRRRTPKPVTPHPGRFADRVVLLTGAAQGIGAAVARRLAAEGADLVLADRSEVLHELVDELAGAQAAADPVLADLETWQGATAAVDAALARHGRIDVAIHTVGGTIWAKPYQHYTPAEIVAELNRSLMPTLWGCRAVAPAMIDAGGGVIVNVSSVATRGVHRVPYAAAKGGVNAITASLAMELAPHGIRVSATAPGGTQAPPRRIPRGPAPATETERDWYAAIVEQTTASSLLHRYGTLDEQAAAICFLASDEASYITGSVLPVAGGDLG